MAQEKKQANKEEEKKNQLLINDERFPMSFSKVFNENDSII